MSKLEEQDDACDIDLVIAGAASLDHSYHTLSDDKDEETCMDCEPLLDDQSKQLRIFKA